MLPMPLRSLVVVCALLAAPAARAEVTRFIELEGFGKLLEGDPHSVALTEEGGITLRPKVDERLVAPGLLFGAAGSLLGDVVLARLGQEPALIAVDAKGKTRTLAALHSEFVTAIAEAEGALYVAVSEAQKAALWTWPQAADPSKGKRGRKNAAKGAAAAAGYADAAKTSVAIPARFVWALTPDGAGNMLVATGEPGAILRVSPAGKVDTVFQADEAHIKALVVDAKLGVLAGGGERGIVYHAPSPRGAKLDMRALFDTGNQEVTSIASNGERVFVASVSGQAAAQAAAAAASEGAGEAGRSRPANKAPEVRSTLVKLSLDGTADVLAASTDELLFDLALDTEGRLLVATGVVGKSEVRGRLYRVETKRKMVSLLYQTPSARIVRLLNQAGDITLVEQDGTRLVTLSHEAAREGTYLSPAIDTGVVSRFGLVQLLGDVPGNTRASVSVRTGQTPEPDRSWSPFAASIDAPGNSAVAVPNGRYVQLRLQLSGGPTLQPTLYKARLAFLRQNLPPFVQEIYALPRGQALYALNAQSTGEDSQSRVVVLANKSDEREAGASGSRRLPVRARQVTEPGAVTIRWLTDEPNGDDLLYTLSLRPAAETRYTEVAKDITDPFYTFHGAQLPDGWYVFRVEASDIRSNPPSLAKSDARDSRTMLIDNTPPHFRDLKAAESGGRVVVTGTVSDKLSPLIALEASLDGGPLRPVAPVDGLLDGLRESIRYELPPALSAGTHTVTLRARDEADNVGHAFVRFASSGKK